MFKTVCSLTALPRYFWAAVTVLALLALFGCGSSRSKYASDEVFNRYDSEGKEREGYIPVFEEPGESNGLREEDPLDFEGCIAFALEHAPEVKEGAVKLQLADLSVEDKFNEMFPEIRVRLTVTKPVYSEESDSSDNDDDKTRMRLTFASGAYDPFGAYISHEAQKVLKRVAVISHMDEVEQLMGNIASMYLKMEAQEKKIASLFRIAEIQERIIDYYAAQPDSHVSNPIELLEAQSSHKNTCLALKREQAALQEAAVDMTILIGGDLNVKHDFVTAGTAEALLGKFDPGAVTLEMYKRANKGLQISRLAAETSKYNLALAWSKYIPTFSLGLRTPDPVSSNGTSDRDYYGTLAMETKLLDWGERSRGVEKALLSKTQTVLDHKMANKKAEAEFLQIKSKLKVAAATDEYESGVRELDGVRYRKSQILYESGVISLAKLFAQEVSIAKSEMQLVQVRLSRDLIVLSLKQMSGELFQSLVGEVNDATQ